MWVICRAILITGLNEHVPRGPQVVRGPISSSGSLKIAVKITSKIASVVSPRKSNKYQVVHSHELSRRVSMTSDKPGL